MVLEDSEMDQMNTARINYYYTLLTNLISSRHGRKLLETSTNHECVL